MITSFNSQELTNLSRRELQALAKSNGIKANIKSSLIIEELNKLRREANEIAVKPSPNKEESANAPLSDSVEANKVASKQAPNKENLLLIEVTESPTNMSAVSDRVDISALNDDTDNENDETLSLPTSPVERPRFRSSKGNAPPPPTPCADVLSPPMSVIKRYINGHGKQSGFSYDDENDDENYIIYRTKGAGTHVNRRHALENLANH